MSGQITHMFNQLNNQISGIANHVTSNTTSIKNVDKEINNIKIKIIQLEQLIKKSTEEDSSIPQMIKNYNLRLNHTSNSFDEIEQNLDNDIDSVNYNYDSDDITDHEIVRELEIYIQTESQKDPNNNEEKSAQYIFQKLNQIKEVIFLMHKLGVRGPRGPQGIVGPCGPQGGQGVRGIPGVQGEKGIQGDNGVSGEQGIQGIRGVQGEQGVIGKRGIRGPAGEIGPRGVRGEKGEIGDRGPVGIQGPPGLPGPKGIVGDKGDRGDKGIKGDQGLKGPNGLMGIQGEKGEIGDKGPIGSRGDKGETGEMGDKGETGEAGDKGERGEKGERGLRGKRGPPGEPFNYLISDYDEENMDFSKYLDDNPLMKIAMENEIKLKVQNEVARIIEHNMHDYINTKLNAYNSIIDKTIQDKLNNIILPISQNQIDNTHIDEKIESNIDEELESDSDLYNIEMEIRKINEEDDLTSFMKIDNTHYDEIEKKLNELFPEGYTLKDIDNINLDTLLL